jgi:hypothetical protein
VAVAAGLYHSLALKSNGKVIAWGDDSYGETEVPTGLTNVVAIAAGGYNSLALKGDGTVIVWGINNTGETNVPVGLTNVTAISRGSSENCYAVVSDGTVAAWGNTSFGEVTVPPGLVNVTAIAGGGYHCLALGSINPCPLTNLVATGVSPSQLNLHWTPTWSYPPASLFHIERKMGNSVYGEVSIVSADVTNYLDTDVYCTNQYSYRIKAEYAAGESGYSTEVSPPVVSLTVVTTNVGLTIGSVTYISNGSTFLFTEQATDPNSGIAQMEIIITNVNSGIVESVPYSTPTTWIIGTWPFIFGPYTYIATATDATGSSWFTPPSVVWDCVGNTAGIGLTNIVEILTGDNPLNPWIPPSGDTNNAPPNITLLIPANAQLR